MPKPSDAPWADEPYPLIILPSERPEYAAEKHPSVSAAQLMAEAHNVFIRGLNAIVQQAPYVTGDQDIRDPLAFVDSWCRAIDHHHHTEETVLFPELNTLAGVPGLMDDPKHQHTLFHDGLAELLAYAATTTPRDHSWLGEGGMKAKIDSFVGPLMEHLRAEVDVLLGLHYLDSEELRKTIERTDAMAKRSGELRVVMYKILPLMLGNSDTTSSQFPYMPSAMIYATKYWFGAGNGAWRFNACDFWGRPRPLAFGPQSGQQG